MRVALVSERARGRGASEACWNLALALQDAGVDVGYFFAEESAEAEAVFGTAARFGSWQRSNRAIRAMRDLEPGTRRWFDNHLLRREELAESRHALLEHLEAFDPDVVHVHNVGAVGGHTLVSAIRRRFPTVWTAHDRYPFELFHNTWKIDGEESTTWEYAPGGRPSTVGLELFKRLPLPVTIITPSRWLADIGREVLAGSAHTVSVIPNLIPNVEPPGPIFPLSEMLDVEMVAIASITDPSYNLKGFEIARQAMAMARSGSSSATGEPELAMVVVTTQTLGMTSDGIYTLTDLARMGMIDRAGYLDRSEMATLYQACDVLVLPSFIENLPNVVVEAAAAGRPAIATRVGGVPEVVVEGESGWLFEPGDVSSLARQLRASAADATERQRRGALARSMFSGAYTPSVVLQAHLDTYQAIARAQPSPFMIDRDLPVMELDSTKYSPRRTPRLPRMRGIVRAARRRLGRLLRGLGLRP